MVRRRNRRFLLNRRFPNSDKCSGLAYYSATSRSLGNLGLPSSSFPFTSSVISYNFGLTKILGL
jgi:hypothetical protein